MDFGAFFDGTYLPAHKRPLTRYLHFVGTTLAAIFLFAFAVTFQVLWLVAVPIAGYGFAWPAHWLVEGNQPETFRKPIASLGGDMMMLALWCAGSLAHNIAEAKHRFPAAWQ